MSTIKKFNKTPEVVRMFINSINTDLELDEISNMFDTAIKDLIDFKNDINPLVNRVEILKKTYIGKYVSYLSLKYFCKVKEEKNIFGTHEKYSDSLILIYDINIDFRTLTTNILFEDHDGDITHMQITRKDLMEYNIESIDKKINIIDVSKLNLSKIPKDFKSAINNKQLYTRFYDLFIKRQNENIEIEKFLLEKGFEKTDIEYKHRTVYNLAISNSIHICFGIRERIIYVEINMTTRKYNYTSIEHIDYLIKSLKFINENSNL